MPHFTAVPSVYLLGHAAMGCRIEGERLGLGVNLFSDVPTLIEQMGFTEFNYELTLTSSYYLQQFLTGKRQ